MLSPGAVRRGQRRAKEKMPDKCVVSRVIGETTNPVTGVVEDLVEFVYEGACKLQRFNAQGSEPTAAGHVYLIGSYQLHFPFGTNHQYGVGTSMQVRLVESTDNPQLVGIDLRLTEPDLRTFATADRWNVERVIS